jgi:hypothetical protein
MLLVIQDQLLLLNSQNDMPHQLPIDNN